MYLPDHGANPKALYERLGLTMPEQVIDLSENVNALGQPAGMKEVWQQLFTTLSAYPHMQAEPLRSELASGLSVDASHVVVTNGAAEGLMALAQLVKGREAILLEPSFSEYKRTLQQQGIEVLPLLVDDICSYQVPLERLAEMLHEKSVLYICNPNNPTGVCQSRKMMLQLVELTKKYGAWLIVDEAFIDFTNESSSVVDLVKSNPHLFVLRSMTKMYALASARLGYVVSQQATKLAQFLPHWSVSGVAIELGRFCLQQHDFVKQSKEFSDEQRLDLQHFLRARGCLVTDSSTNFLAFKPPFAVKPFYTYLLSHGIVTRHTENFLGLDGDWLRIGMKDALALAVFKERWQHYENDSLHSPRTNGME